MPARHRATLILGVLTVALFLIHWPLDNYTCDMATWGKYRPSQSAGVDFMQTVFRGGGGTPAVFAMLGGQRYMVANIMWTYSDVLFHKGKLFEMIPPMDATVTLNPSFTEAWSTYGWMLAWNLYSYTDDPIEKKRWLDAGIQVFIRAVKANPGKPIHRADLANCYAEREGNIYKALQVLAPVMESGKFPPLTPDLKKKYENMPDVLDSYWDPYNVGHHVAIYYKRLGIFTGDWRYIQKSIATYQECQRVDPDQRDKTQKFIDDMQSHMHDRQWLLEERAIEDRVRKNFGMEQLTYDTPVEQMFSESKTGVENSSAPQPK